MINFKERVTEKEIKRVERKEGQRERESKKRLPMG